MQQIQLTRINNDVNGNPRYCVHFLDLLSTTESHSSIPVEKRFSLALQKAKTIGGSKYRGKQYGGMIVFQSYNTDNLIKSIKELQNNQP